ncbi:MAG TPA: arylsulfotransferase family protein [Solirubrobacteraceae bacterium]|nr:arylsulfotransferase family protein [Solirubrobacteraceae bacterium]
MSGSTPKLRLPLAVAIIACVAALAPAAAQAAPIGAFTTKGAWTFVSRPDLHPPKLTTDLKTQRGLTSGYFMTGVFKNLTVKKPMVGQSGPLILDHNLQPVWFRNVGPNVLAANLTTQTYNGKPVLSWWQGTVSPTGVTTSGTDVVVDQHYRQVAALHGADGWVISQHEMIISGANAWVTAYKTVPTDLTAFGGSANGAVLDSAVQEYSLKTGQLLYTWDALNPGGTPNIPLSQSQQKAPPAPGIPWDAYHINSIQLTGHETFLVSMRNTWTAYLVDRLTNGVVWKVSGNPRNSTFSLPAKARFQWQHDVQLHDGNVLSVFDDACCEITGAKNGVATFGKPSGPSRGLVIKLDLTKHTGSFVSQYIRLKNFNVGFLGNAQLLPGGNVAVSWGSAPFFSEFNHQGKFLLDAVWPVPDLSYRTYVQKWTGIPFYAPSGGVRNNQGKTTVYASWDGATQVVSWRVLAGSSAKSLKAVASKTKTGFETTIPLTSSSKVYEVQALDSRHHVLGTSKPFPTTGSSGSGLPQGY